MAKELEIPILLKSKHYRSELIDELEVKLSNKPFFYGLQTVDEKLLRNSIRKAIPEIALAISELFFQYMNFINHLALSYHGCHQVL